MAESVKTIGTLASENYTTIVGFEADINNTTFPVAGTQAVGEVSDQSLGDENVVWSWTASNVTDVTLRPASGAEHDGTAGTGARQVQTADGVAHDINTQVWIEHIEIDMNGNSAGFDRGIVEVGGTVESGCRRCLIHDHGTGNNRTGAALKITDAAGHAIRNVIYDIAGSGVNDDSTIENLVASSGTNKFYNNTVFNSTTKASMIDVVDDTANKAVQNNIAITNNAAGGKCYSDAAPTTIVCSHNVASDTTASGTGSVDSESATIFVSTTGGSEDLHLASGATNEIDGGTDLGTALGSEIDIDLRDVDAAVDDWDMGADEFVTAVTPTILDPLQLPELGAAPRPVPYH